MAASSSAAAAAAQSASSGSKRVWRDEYETNMAAVESSDVAIDGECVMGIDEAGRGPVLGPLVYGACWCRIADKEKLKAIGYDDSKKLKEGERDGYFANIKSGALPIKLGWRVHVSAPEELSNKMLRQVPYNLNAISHDAAIWLIDAALKDGVQLREVFVDTVGSPEKYEAKLSARFPRLRITVRPKADSLYPIVSAASICAKVTRDELLERWQFTERGLVASRAFGSGYPGDPTTKKWLKEHIDPVFGFPSIIRFSWKTTTKLLSENAVPVEFPELYDDFDEQQAFKRRAVLWKERREFFASNNMELPDF